jgi:predicted ArsR family transcriptional regulator
MLTSVYHDHRVDLPERTQRRIRHALEYCHGLPLTELSNRITEPESLVRSHLEAMIMRGEIECLRPVNYLKDDHDFYSLVRPSSSVMEHPWDD